MANPLRDRIPQLQVQLGKVILGKPEVIENLVIALLSGSHILMEDVPGVGKTTLAKALAKLLWASAMSGLISSAFR